MFPADRINAAGSVIASRKGTSVNSSQAYAAALLHHRAGRLDEAERLYRQALAADPRHADSLHLLGVISSQMQRHEEAAGLIGQAIAINPGAAAYQFNLANVSRSLGRPDEAIACYRLALERQPSFPGAHYHLAGVLQELGRREEAIACYRSAIDLSPEDPLAHNNLGAVLKEQGRGDDALACYRCAIALKPDFAEAHYNLGLALQGLEHLDDAVDCYRAAIRFRPDWPVVHNDLGSALKELGRLDEAAGCYRRAIALQPDHPGAHNNLGTVLKDQGRIDEAIACFRRAIALKPDLVAAQTNLGAALKDQGRFEEAIAIHHKALLSGPDANTYYELSSCRKFTAADRPLIADMTALLKQSTLAPQKRALLHFALGKIFDDLAEPETAIGHFDEANRLGRANVHFDRPDFAARIDRLIAAFPQDAMSPDASDSQLPVLIVGMPRSGTTLAEQILASHPQVAAGGELNFWLQRSDWAGKQYAGRMDAAAEKNAIRDYLALLTGIARGAARVTDKMPYNFLFLGLVHRLFPGARIIHCRRNPIDTALSLYFNRFGKTQEFTWSRSDIVFYHRQYERLMKHWRTALPADRFLEIDYEKLVADQEAVSRRMVAFCGLDWDGACLDFHNTARPVATASAWQVRQPLYNSSVDRWRRYEPWLGELRELLP
jgi:tetratricopeptide (TPR) repeat protein